MAREERRWHERTNIPVKFGSRYRQLPSKLLKGALSQLVVGLIETQLDLVFFGLDPVDQSIPAGLNTIVREAC